jgi:hypothetical protein
MDQEFKNDHEMNKELKNIELEMKDKEISIIQEESKKIEDETKLNEIKLALVKANNPTLGKSEEKQKEIINLFKYTVPQLVQLCKEHNKTPGRNRDKKNLIKLLTDEDIKPKKHYLDFHIQDITNFLNEHIEYSKNNILPRSDLWDKIQNELKLIDTPTNRNYFYNYTVPQYLKTRFNDEVLCNSSRHTMGKRENNSNIRPDSWIDIKLI